jgi:UPF0042 nucleotide-binding protein
LRALTGADDGVIEYLDSETVAQQYFKSLQQFMDAWIPHFRADNRSYLSIAIGCTGGQHRSVYLVDKLADHLDGKAMDVIKRHRELE